MLVKPDLLLPLIVFCIATLYTPGPNNVMLMTSALNFGMRRTLPHIFGVVFGFALLVFCTGLGLGVVFTRYPLAYTVLKYAGSAYLVYLAWLIASSDPSKEKTTKAKRPMRFYEGVAFQLVNAKGWIMAIGSVSTYAAVAVYPYNAAIIAGLFGMLGIGSSFAWAAFGAVLQKWMKNPKIIRSFNIVMALLLVASIYPVFAD
jgi:threonine/homoserine/homoserine lactone efflux protein